MTVLLVHATFTSGFTLRVSFGNYLARLEIGVAVFFLISGFLLYRPFVDAALKGDDRPATWSFYKRRLLRIVPAYWVALTLITFAFHGAVLGGFRGAFLDYGFLQIYSQKQILSGIAQAWSLCTEITFYLFLPVYAMLLTTRRRSSSRQLRAELVGVGCLVATSILFKVWVFSAMSPGLQGSMREWLPGELDLFALGMLVAVASAWMRQQHREPAVAARWWMPWLSWGLAAGAYWAVSTQIGLTLQPIYRPSLVSDLERQFLYGAFAFFLILPAVFGPQRFGLIRQFLRCRPVAYIGLVSYGIYIWHQVFIEKYSGWFGARTLHEPILQVSLFAVTTSLLVATLSYRLVEQPFLRLKGRPPGRARLAPETTTLPAS
jgi:peptidoglycan/LPS O-acetylase OafA/YrhL